MRFKVFLLLACICQPRFLPAQSPNEDRIKIGSYFLPFPDYKKSEIDGITFARIIVDPQGWEGVDSFSGIEQLRNLRRLEIGGENLSRVDFTPLGQLPDLIWLTIRPRSSSLERLPDLGSLKKLEILEVYNQDLKYLEGIEKIPRLKKLEIKWCETAIRDVGVLSSLKELTWLSLSCPGTVISFADLRGLESVTNLYLEACKVVDFSGIQALSGLTELTVSACGAENLRELSALRGLTRLGLDFARGYNLNAISALGGIENLEKLALSAYNDTKEPRLDARLLKDCVSVTALGLFGFTIENFDALNDLPCLEYVYTGNSVFVPEENNLLRGDIQVEYRRRSVMLSR